MRHAAGARTVHALVAVLVTAAAVITLSLVIGSGREAAVAAGWAVAAETWLNISPRKLAAVGALGGVLGLVGLIVTWRALPGFQPPLRLIASLASRVVIAGPPWLLAGHTNPAFDRLTQRFAFVRTGWRLLATLLMGGFNVRHLQELPHPFLPATGNARPAG